MHTKEKLKQTRNRKLLGLLGITSVILWALACGSDTEQKPTLVIGGIPDQNISVLEERFNSVAGYLADDLNVEVKYVPVTEYASLITAFKNGDVMLGWFGGLSGVQARLLTPGATAIAQRPADEEFTSVFIVRRNFAAETLDDLKGLSFTFGSTNSTSGHLMPRSFLLEAGVDPESDLKGVPNYSGSHDLTWKLVESGSFDAGALNSSVWNRAVASGQVDTSKVRVLLESEPYVDYHWLAHPDIDRNWGPGTVERLKQGLLAVSGETEYERKILGLFETESFIATENSNYEPIEEIGRSLNMLQ